MSEASNPTFSLQAAGSTPANESRQVSEVEMDAPDAATESGGDSEQNARQWADKFNSPEELEKSYLELQSKYSSERAATGDMTFGQLFEHLDLSAEELGANWSNDGQLSEEQYEKFRAGGFSKEMVNQVFRGERAIQENGVYAKSKLVERANDLAGGEEEMAGLLKWAGEHYEDSRKKMMEDRLNDPSTFEDAIKAMLFDYKQVTGRGGSVNLVQGDIMPNTTAGYTSADEVFQAMQEYRKTGKMDEVMKRRIKNTPSHIMQGIDP